MRALGSDAKYAPLLELVDIFARGTLANYMDFYSRHNTYLAQVGLDHDRCLETMRLLTLCAMATINSQLSYDAIMEGVQVSFFLFCFSLLASPPPPFLACDDSEFLVCD